MKTGEEPMKRTLFFGGEIFDSIEAQLIRSDVSIAGGHIVEVGTGLDGDEAVDVTGMSLLPGLFDCHVHLIVSRFDYWRSVQTPFSYPFYEAVGHLESTLRAGITTVRDAGGADLGMKEAVDHGLISGPRMQIAVNMISQTGGHADCWFPSGIRLHIFPIHPGCPETVVDGPEQVRHKVRQLVQYGAGVIKVATSGGVLSPRDNIKHAHLRKDELDMLVTEARAAGLFVMAHAIAADGVKNAVRAGVRSVEHGVFLDDEAIDLMLRNGTYLVPTLVAPEGVLRAADEGAPINSLILAKAREAISAHRESFRKAVSAGVRIAMGTDSGVVPHGENLRELQLLQQGGMKPEQVLVAATSAAAGLMGLDRELGSIEPGKRADLVIVKGDPFEFATIGERIAAVYKDGRKVVG
jgi:imidazolonepropionase-like amidohydrolase